MNQSLVDKIVQAVLYEGYNLYPYRPSVKNRCRWTFGGLYPRSYSEAMEGTDAWSMQVQCLVQVGCVERTAEEMLGSAPGQTVENALSSPGPVRATHHGGTSVLHPRYGEPCAVEVKLRFLHLTQRTIGLLPVACDELPAGEDPVYETVDSLLLNGTRYQGWQEAVEREVTIGPLTLVAHSSRATVKTFTAPAGHTLQPLRGPDGRIAAVIVRDQEALEGSAEVSAERLEDSVFRLTVRVFNRASLEDAGLRSRDEALMRSLVALHAVLSVREGKFFSLTDPPEALREAAAACRNLGAWPVLVGSPGEQDAMLASPIILYDYPQIAPESPGDLFDGTEIDEILTLRIMTLTDEEKAMAEATDDRTRRLIERTESLAREQLAGLHGAVRALEPQAGQLPSPACGLRQDGRLPAPRSPLPAWLGEGEWDPFAQRPAIERIIVDDVELRPGDRVRLRPGLGGDIFDLALAGKTATIESIEQDYEDQFHVAVTLDDDPGQDLGRARQPGHRFFFKPQELAPLRDDVRKVEA